MQADIETTDPQPAPEPKKAEGVGSLEMIAAACAMIASGVMMIGVLYARGPAPSDPVAPAGAPGATARTVPASIDAPTGSRWVENNTVWTGNAKRSVAFELPARNETPVWTKVVRPLLVVRCTDGVVDAFVFTDSAIAMEARDEDHTVRFSFDGQSERTERWPDSATHDALFAPDGGEFTRQLIPARRLRFAYTPHNAGAVEAYFEVTGLSEKVEAAPACRPRR